MAQPTNYLKFSLAISLICLSLNASCVATHEARRPITSSDTAWIEAGKTTRFDITTAFGTPYMEYPETLQDNQVGRKALYYQMVTMADSTLAVTRQELFWVRYDPVGVVVDFGIETINLGDPLIQ